MAKPSAATIAPTDLAAWLRHIEQLHPKAISMGLERVRQVIARLSLKPHFNIITVAGTNGKGSTCAMLAEVYKQAGYQVGCYTSPHLVRYNERVRINGLEVSDEALCAAFMAVEQARIGHDAAEAEIALTYFEMGTLAAVWHFIAAGIDIAILEIGMGGRLDAVNAFEPDCTIVTSVDIDHQEFLGNTRESIGAEKAGVFRPRIAAICGDLNPPASLIAYAHQIGADVKCIGNAFDAEIEASGWSYIVDGRLRYTLPMPALEGDYQLINAACAVTAIETLQSTLPVDGKAIADAMREVTLAGRFQTVSTMPWVILDVAHNPHAAKALAKNLQAICKDSGSHEMKKGRTIAVFAMLGDKDIPGVVNAVKEHIDSWYLSSIDHIRSASVEMLAKNVRQVLPQAEISLFSSPAQAFQQACNDIEVCNDRNGNDKIIVFGSFFTVSSVMQYMNDDAARPI